MKRVERTSKPKISFYFPDSSCQQLLSIDAIAKYQDKFQIDDLLNDWQQAFCEEIGFAENRIPWNKLRALQFDIDDDIQTAVCCDPVMMQMTHRGAYLWGQSQLEFSKEDVIRINAQINQQLMGDDECFYLLNNYQWLYTNKKAIELNQTSFDEYIGKDMFGFSYSGKDGNFWDKLATEIQMLIKQMMDYQGLKSPPAEMIVNVHFWGETKNRRQLPFEQLDKDNQVFVSDDSLALFFQESGVKASSINEFKTIVSTNNKVFLRDLLVIMTNNEITDFSQNIEDHIQTFKRHFSSVRLITQDKSLEIYQTKSVWQKLVDVFKKMHLNRNILMKKGNRFD